MLKIWGRTNSTNVKKVLWIAEELGLEYEQIDVGGQFGGLQDASFLARNPNGLIPLLEDGNTTLWESNVIVRYLAATHAKSGLWIEAPAERAQAEKWMDWAPSTLYADFRDVITNLIRLPEDRRDKAAMQRGIDGMTRSLKIADQALANQPWLSGENFGVGDIPLGCYAYAWFEFPIERASTPHLEDWYNRLAQRPAYRKAVMTPLT
ncbi:glutathione S-transferase [Brucella pituitosa]|uniref:glutathione S-transferase family protein n=1 Tax=Brucella TaxID=234 RepID=UPI000465E30D|nr:MULTISPECIES: glutathione S-transferase [Brucella]PQZ51990.1 glutathione S-transferase [Ochrobactrum sp. MYb19]PRA62680.1 glutathione S-transferase [Ochrobactrum sp. MYb18]PRA76666.1 glutathione S-transferase [Brucella thiophenivorans]PRA87217.1 glutathione S-transferase [Ochrobactrum sp. MYb29]PRA93701.1 glutathione S-transferase [Ochrobactrum sp. MYb14]PRA98673.1 glutathione S-transferase [Ochrobactrum sp. MYb15]